MSQPLVWSALITVAAFVFVACGGGSTTPTTEGTSPPEGQPMPAQPFSEACQKTGEKQFSEPPPQIIDTNRTYVATIKTAKGEIVVELFSDTPITTNNFVFLACKGFYDGLTFHRVVPDFVIQGGDPTGTGRGDPGYSIPDEDDGDHRFDEGVISMAKAGPNTAGSQFFITIGPRENLAHLDPDFTVFGQVVSGLDVAKQITVGDVIETITIEER